MPAAWNRACRKHSGQSPSSKTTATKAFWSRVSPAVATKIFSTRRALLGSGLHSCCLIIRGASSISWVSGFAEMVVLVGIGHDQAAGGRARHTRHATDPAVALRAPGVLLCTAIRAIDRKCVGVGIGRPDSARLHADCPSVRRIDQVVFGPAESVTTSGCDRTAFRKFSHE